MLDPMSALSLAGNIVQFVDFSSKIVSKGRRIYLSAEGALPKNLELEVVANDLSQLAARLRTDGLNKATPSEEETSLKIISDECSKIAKELLKRLDKLKVKSDAKHRGWKSLRQALKSVWNKEELDDLAERLSLFRNQLQTDILFSLK
jgi:flagellar motility protein MotE (MotC chaperone)